MRLLKTICFLLGAAVLILAFSTDLSMEGCSERYSQVEIRNTKEELLNPTESPKYYSEQAYNDARTSTEKIGDEARSAKDDLVEHGKNIGTEAINGTVKTTKNATKSYFGFLGNLINNVKKDWHDFLVSIGYPEDMEKSDTSYTDQYKELEREQNRKIRDAWEGRTSQNTTSDNNTDKTAKELPNASDSVKKKIYRLPNGGRNTKNARWIDC